jgi:hypothetical protein
MITHTLQTLLVKISAVAISLVAAAAMALCLNWAMRQIDGARHNASHKAPTSVQYVLPDSKWQPGHPTASRIIF